MFSCLRAACSCSSFSILFCVLRLSSTLLNCSSRELVAELLAALHHQHFVDGADQQAGRDFVERFAQLGAALVGRQVDGLAFLAQRLHLPGFKIALGQDLAIHLHEHLLDDLGARDGRGEHQAAMPSPGPAFAGEGG